MHAPAGRVIRRLIASDSSLSRLQDPLSARVRAADERVSASSDCPEIVRVALLEFAFRPRAA